MIDVLLVDDHRIFRTGLQRLLSDEADMRVTAQAGSWSEALAAIRGGSFGVVVLDINLGGRSGLEILEQVRQLRPALPVLMMSMYPAEQFAAAAFAAGANGYLSKDAEPGELVKAIRTVAGGRNYTTASTAQLLTQTRETDQPLHYRLSAREMEILNLIAAGDSLTTIGGKLFLSVKTISTYRSRILEKLNVGSNAELLRYAVSHGIGGVTSK